jgi:hypothetical protein
VVVIISAVVGGRAAAAAAEEEEEEAAIKIHIHSTIHLSKKRSTSSNYPVLVMQ